METQYPAAVYEHSEHYRMTNQTTDPSRIVYTYSTPSDSFVTVSTHTSASFLGSAFSIQQSPTPVAYDNTPTVVSSSLLPTMEQLPSDTTPVPLSLIGTTLSSSFSSTSSSPKALSTHSMIPPPPPLPTNLPVNRGKYNELPISSELGSRRLRHVTAPTVSNNIVGAPGYSLFKLNQPYYEEPIMERPMTEQPMIRTYSEPAFGSTLQPNATIQQVPERKCVHFCENPEYMDSRIRRPVPIPEAVGTTTPLGHISTSSTTTATTSYVSRAAVRRPSAAKLKGKLKRGLGKMVHNRRMEEEGQALEAAAQAAKAEGRASQ